MAFCTGCGTEVPAGVVACPSCGLVAAAPAAAGSDAPASPSAGGLTDNVAGALAYFTFIPAIIFLVMEPYNRNKFLRFHSFQCLFLSAACFVLNFVVGLIPVVNIVAVPLLVVGELVIWLVLVLKAYQGQKFKLPVLGDLAEQQANAG